MGAPGEMDTLWNENYQRAKKVVSDSAGLVGFAIKLVNFVLARKASEVFRKTQMKQT